MVAQELWQRHCYAQVGLEGLLMVFLQSIKQFVQTLIFATIIWGVEIAWLACLGIAIVKLIK
jgi:hypothetical protein